MYNLHTVGPNNLTHGHFLNPVYAVKKRTSTTGVCDTNAHRNPKIHRVWGRGCHQSKSIIHGPKPYTFIGVRWALISRKPVVATGSHVLYHNNVSNPPAGLPVVVWVGFGLAIQCGRTSNGAELLDLWGAAYDSVALTVHRNIWRPLRHGGQQSLQATRPLWVVATRGSFEKSSGLSPDLINQLRLRPKSKIDFPRDPVRNRTNTHDFHGKVPVRTLPRDPPEDRGPKNKIKIRFEHSQDKGVL